MRHNSDPSSIGIYDGITKLPRLDTDHRASSSTSSDPTDYALGIVQETCCKKHHDAACVLILIQLAWFGSLSVLIGFGRTILDIGFIPLRNSM